MPLYEYQCDACAHRFEVIQKYADAPIAVCPNCGGAVQKLASSPAIQFKGSGWYITDYARAGTSDSGSLPSGKDTSATPSSESAPSAATADTKAGDQAEPKAKADAKTESKPKASSASD